MADAAFRNLLMERGFDPAYLGRAELSAALEADRRRWEPVLQRTGISPE